LKGLENGGLQKDNMMIGFSIMMWFVSIILVLVSISLLKGNYSAIHGKVFDNIKNKECYAKALGKPVLVMGIGIALSGFIAVATNSIICSLIVILCVAVFAGIYFYNIQKRFS